MVEQNPFSNITITWHNLSKFLIHSFVRYEKIPYIQYFPIFFQHDININIIIQNTRHDRNSARKNLNEITIAQWSRIPIKRAAATEI